MTEPINHRTLARFWSKVDKTGDCWLWTAARTSSGYGALTVGGKTVSAHRLSFEITNGPVPTGLKLDHLCRTPACVNPTHIEAVTHRENCRRGVGASGQNARKTSCVNGHPFDKANTYKCVTRPGRQCRECHRQNALKPGAKARVRLYQRRWRAANPLYQQQWRAAKRAERRTK